MMYKRTMTGCSGKVLLVIAIIMFGGMIPDAVAYDDGDLQIWNTDIVAWKVADEWKMALEEEFRFADDAGEMSYQHTDLSVVYGGLADWLDVGLAYRFIFERKGDTFKKINQPHVNAKVKWSFWNIPMSNRGRLEYREREAAEDGWRYRNKFTVQYPRTFTRSQLRPYLADEIFVDLDAEELNRNRFYAGCKTKLTDRVTGDVFYLWQASKSGDSWVDSHVLGLGAKVTF